MKKLGIIGGLGPMATACFMGMLVEMTDAQIDQEHIETICYSCPSIPDRTQYILDRQKESPVEPMAEIGKKLVDLGVSYIATPCITAHYFHEELEKRIGIPIIHAVRETGDYLFHQGVSRVGILATDGTVCTRIFSGGLRERNIECLYPEPEMQKKVMEIIYLDVKAGKAADLDKFHLVSESLFRQGAEVILLGCTELSLVPRSVRGRGYLDVMEVLAAACVARCGKLKPSYQKLIS